MSGPLSNPRHERYAFERALLTPRLLAARAAGYDKMTAGNAAKLDRKPHIAERIRELRGIDEEMAREKAARLEERLNESAYGNIFDFAPVNEVTGKPEIDWKAVSESDLARTIAEFIFDKDSGALIRFKRENALEAISQLRDMLGLRAPTKTAFTDPKGDGPGEIVVYSSRDKARAVAAILAKAKVEAKAA